MAAQKEIPMDDAELDALMAELDAETADMIATPTVAAAAAPEPEPTPPEIDDQDIAEMEAQEVAKVAEELNARGEVSTNDTVALAQTEAARKSDDDELAALQAELDHEGEG